MLSNKQNKMGEGNAPRITRKALESFSKGKLIDIVRDMESYLLSMSSVNYEMSWRGAPEDTQRAYTRWDAFSAAVKRLQELAR